MNTRRRIASLFRELADAFDDLAKAQGDPLPAVSRADVATWLGKVLADPDVDTRTALQAAAGRLEHVYFVQSDAGPIKIGTTGDVNKRVAQLQGASPVALQLVHSMRGGRGLEEAIHARFRHLRIRGEWFRADPELLQFIRHLEYLT